MPGIVLSLLVTLITLSFAFHPGDTSIRRGLHYDRLQQSKRSSTDRTRTRNTDPELAEPDHSGSLRSSD